MSSYLYKYCKSTSLRTKKKMATTFGKQVLRTPHIYNILITNCNSKTKNWSPKVVYIYMDADMLEHPPPKVTLMKNITFSNFQTFSIEVN